MKTERSLTKSADACLRQAMKLSEQLQHDLYTLWTYGESADKKKLMPRIRAQSQVMLERIHEYNAYSNTLETK